MTDSVVVVLPNGVEEHWGSVSRWREHEQVFSHRTSGDALIISCEGHYWLHEDPAALELDAWGTWRPAEQVGYYGSDEWVRVRVDGT